MKKLVQSLFVMLLIATSVLAQDKKVTGKVTAKDDGMPLPGVSVKVTGTNIGTQTNVDGKYSITIPLNSRTIEVSYVGFSTQKLVVGDNTVINVSLASDAKALSEVIVNGIVPIKRKEFAGAATSISSENLGNKPVASFDQLLQGRVPGLSALTSSGAPGSSTNIIIRGSSSLAGGSTPLYIVDGVPIEQNTFQGLNSNDFESVEVLRDASASALYGSRGANGVIVISTKRGKAGKLTIGFDSQFGVKTPPSFAFTPQSTKQLLQTQENYGLLADPNGSVLTNANNLPGWVYSPKNPGNAGLTPAQKARYASILDSISQINTNWHDVTFKNGTFSNNQVTLSGGGEKVRSFTSLGLYNEKGTTARSSFDRVTLRNNIDITDNKFKAQISSSLAYVSRSNQQSTTTNSTGNPFLSFAITPPYSVPTLPDGNYYTGTGAKFVGGNQLQLTALDINKNNQLKALLSGTASYEITNHLSAAITSGIDYRETQGSNYGNKLAYVRITSTTPTGKAGFQSESLTRFLTANVRPSFTYQNLFNNKHSVNFSVLGEYVGEFAKSLSLTGYGIDPRTPNTPAAITQATASNQLFGNLGGGKSQNTLLSAMIIGNYTYDGKYTLNASYRNDGSSKLPEKNRWVGFYSISGVWNAKQENFLKDVDFVNSLRFKASYGGSGNNGNDNFAYGDFGYLPQFSLGTTLTGNRTLFPSNVGNPDLTWEKVYQTNIGIDFDIFRGKIFGELNVYNKVTKDLFVQKTLSATSGLGVGGSIIVNAGQLQNRGFEWDINYRPIDKNDFIWTIYANGAYNQNKITSLGGEQSYESGTGKITEGLPSSAQYTVRWGGVDAATGAPLYYTKDGKLTTNYSSNDQVQTFGQSEAPWKGGFGTELRYKQFGFSTLFSFQQGATKSDNLEYFVENTSFIRNGYNQSTSLDFWQKPGDIASTPSPVYSSNFSSKILHDASFIRLRDVTISYFLPKSILTKSKFISSAKLYVQGTNLIMFTKWRGPDPEAGAPNINLSEYPNPTAFTAGLNFTF
ncbi:SusC/RagA family TonB-linked outer membrane protein [Pedobacter sp. SD-b]|uniref:SusC/RagA family TonB-linked outer membrane protein n=1 Tax=Pedobacter segetis TaxID=2793069 RepID=A0ABS1BFC2_9SPHI|nr:SusC/RagA family TonB-linked outer membrane protein [Pedobacter segetis]MBK0381560.1 SusC/RagA family TonB-linked outer membrane protein [Pedobacter segetis]